MPHSFRLISATAVAVLPLAPAVATAQDPGADQLNFQLADGLQIERVVGGLNFPTSLTWDDQGRMHIAEAGGALYPQETAPIRILRIEGGEATEVVNLSGQGVMTAVVGLTWHDGAFYFTHRDTEDLTGAVSRVTREGEVELLFDGLIDSQSEHQINDIAVGPDGRMYVSVGPAGNSGVVDPSVAPWVQLSPELHPVPCQDIVLTGRNFKTPDFRTKDDEEDMAVTGAYVPFGTETTPGQTISGEPKCGGSS